MTRLLVRPHDRATSAVSLLWFSLSLVCALLFGLRGMDGAFEEKYIIQDDARQHVFWMQRFTDPELFPDDLIANYYQTVAPSGYTTLYRIGAAAGIDPIRLSKILPILLGLITTAYCFGFTLQVLPVPFAAFLSSLLLNQALWSRDDIVSATARAFLYPLFLAFLYYLARRKFIPCLVALTLQALFYPSIAFVSAGMLALGLIAWKGKRPVITRDRFTLWLCASGLAAIVIVLAFYASKSSGLGEVITASQARQMAEFQTGGRVSFFRDDYLFYLTRGIYSGLLPGHIPELLWTAVLFPVLFLFKSRLPILAKAGKLSILAHVMISSIFLFVAAHAVLFRLYLPSRYTQHTFRIVLCIVAAISLVTILDIVIRWATRGREDRIHLRAIIGMTVIAALILMLVIGSISLPDIPQRRFRVGKEAAFYDFFAAQPKDAVIASLDDEADNIPSFSARTVLVAREYALPYHLRYYYQLRERGVDLINAQYTRDLNEVKRFIEKHGVDFIVVDKKAFEPGYAKRNRLVQQFLPELAERNDLATSALSSVMRECAVFETERLIVVDAARILGKS
ncbi:MAG TPA: hypothetical protein VF131_00125 [Blastocatellia bacterium]|nr:hypothetical protein [Blastocatellia bacterium]